MSFNKYVIKFYLVAACIIIVKTALAIDNNQVGNNHPYGITSSGLNTTINKENNTFHIKGGSAKDQNLFHSFDQFNLHTGESAIFYDQGFNNTFGRITGNSYSWINGKLTSSAENLYLMNPQGFMFGPESTLDLNGSFHITSAD